MVDEIRYVRLPKALADVVFYHKKNSNANVLGMIAVQVSTIIF